MKRALAGLACALVFSATAGPAGAGSLGISSGNVLFEGAPGEQNVLAVVNGAPGRFQLTDFLNPITVLGDAMAVCTGSGTMTVDCPLAPRLIVSMGDGNDGLVMNDAVPMSLRLDGESGNDNADGSGLADVMDGGEGNDTVEGDGGDDRILPNLGTDTVDGGAGTDTLDYDDDRSAGVTVNLNTGVAPEGDQFSAFENLTGSFFDDYLTGDGGANVLRGNPGADTLHDGGYGFDLLNYSGYGSAVTLDLTSGVNNVGDILLGQWEGAIGSSQDDTLGAPGAMHPVRLEGQEGNDTLVGGDAGDLLIGGAGADGLDGGPSLDIASYRERATPVVSSLLPGGPREDLDSYTLIEGLEGGSGNDVLRGDDAVNALIGNAGADTLAGGLGADHLHGQAICTVVDGSTDTVSYDDGRTTPVVTELGGGHQDNDVYCHIQNLVGGAGDDLLIGDAGANVLIGNSGADVLVGGRGVDDLRGGLPNGNPDASIDVASYRDYPGAVTASLVGPTNPDGDLFSDIAGLEGGGGKDTLVGSAGADLLFGGAGNDTLTGLAGPDELRGEGDDDSLLGRDGERDILDCGPGDDEYEEDAIDVLTACELRPVAPAPPLRCVVPNVKRKTVARARRMLNARRCRLGKVRRVYSRKVRKGWIVSQSRRPGARLQRNTKVNVVVSRGRRRR